MACPYFMPTSRHDAELWMHRQRLSLGDGFAGTCTAPGRNGCAASDAELKDLCNLGYASACGHLPAHRLADAVRFAVACDSADTLTLQWSSERDHLPVAHGQLEYDTATARFTTAHNDLCVQRMAECFIESYLLRHPRQRSASNA
jgi:hypothetical protein